MALSPGARFGPYEVSAQIGQGGMGEVYQATDTKLGRQVAVKVLPASLAQDADRLARFGREARTLAALNHPNIAAIYGLEEEGGTTALVMELVEGPTLADRILEGAIPVHDALPIARQIAEALEAAHERGIIHRDLKPANVKVRPDGTVKVLDFGLAKAIEPVGGMPPDASQLPTITTPAMTQAGIILGTAAYMSPEQAKGRRVDRRTDVWALGCVLFEMLTGTRAFGGDDVSDTLASVLKAEPAWEALPAGLPPALTVFVRRALEKDPRQRVADIQDLRLALDGAFEPSVNVTAEQAGGAALRLWQRPMPAAGIGLAIFAAALALGGLVPDLRPEPPQHVVRVTIQPSVDEPLRVVVTDPSLALTPDGRYVVYNSGRDNPTGGITVRALDALTGSRLAELPNTVDSPVPSPDSEWLAYDDGGTAFRRVPLRGGPPQTISQLDGALRGASWGEDDTIVFATVAPDTGLFRVPAAGGEPEQLTTPAAGEADHLWPEMLPGGRSVLFTIVPTGSIVEASVAVLDLDTREYQVLIRGGSHPKYVPTGHIVYGASGTLRAVAFDLGGLAVRGNSRLVVDAARTEVNGASHFSVAANGSMAYIRDTAGATPRGRVAWVTRQGQELPAPLVPNLEAPLSPRLSPDGQRLALIVARDLWVYDVAGRPPIRITTGGGNAPLWTPDGQRILYQVDGSGRSVLSASIDGSGSPVPVSPEGNLFPFGWSRDGGTVVAVHGVGPQREIVQWRLSEPDTLEPVVRTPAYEGAFGAAVSPDGRWLAYASDRDGTQEIFVQSYPSPGPARRVSPAGGHQPVWARDGRELYYLEGSRLMAAALDSTSDLTFAVPEFLFDLGYTALNIELVGAYDVSAAGHFIVVRLDPEAAGAEVSSEIVLVQNWFADLRALVPTD